MSDIENAFCPNKDCKDYGVRNQGNIGKRRKYGKDKKSVQNQMISVFNTNFTRMSNSRLPGFMRISNGNDYI